MPTTAEYSLFGDNAYGGPAGASSSTIFRAPGK